MLTLEEVMDIPIGKGVFVCSNRGRTKYNALVIGTKGDCLRLITENGALSKPQYKTYGKTWYVERIN